jgi:hypothetical protein
LGRAVKIEVNTHKTFLTCHKLSKQNTILKQKRLFSLTFDITNLKQHDRSKPSHLLEMHSEFIRTLLFASYDHARVTVPSTIKRKNLSHKERFPSGIRGRL